MTHKRSRRGTTPNPFEVGERVRTLYYRGAAPERERIGEVLEVERDCGPAAFVSYGNKNMYYRVTFDNEQHKELYPKGEWMTCRGLESIGRPEGKGE